MGFNLFNSIRVKPPKRHAFNLSHDVKLSMSMGDLVPILCEPVLPGDTWKLTTEMLMRFAPLSSPVMHRMNVYTHFFFVPNRLVWDGWQDFITGGEWRATKKDPNNAPAYPTIYFGEDATSTSSRVQRNLERMQLGSLTDYLGFPVGNDNSVLEKIYGVGNPDDGTTSEIDLLPFRAYQLIWDEYYRDQNLQDPVDIHPEVSGRIPIGSAALSPLLSLRKRAWEKDYFTSALPWPQAGDDVRVPLYGDAPVTVNGAAGMTIGDQILAATTTNLKQGDTLKVGSPVGGSAKDFHLTTESGADVAFRAYGDSTPLSGSADMSKVSAATINELRRAFRAQEFLEKSARGGQRYIEQLFSFFGVKSSDARLNRPEYLGGGKSPVVVSDVQQTSQTTSEGADASPQGNLSGQAVSVQKSHSFKRHFEEHGYIIGIMSVIPRTCYQQGLPRKFQKFDRLDYYWPQFANLGEQEIKNSELYMEAADIQNNETFGYTPRYAEYKYLPSRVCGDFRDTLAFWHMGRIFNNRPNLNGNFVTCNPDGRIFAYTKDDVQKLWVNMHHNITAVRAMPVYGTPML